MLLEVRMAHDTDNGTLCVEPGNRLGHEFSQGKRPKSAVTTEGRVAVQALRSAP